MNTIRDLLAQALLALAVTIGTRRFAAWVGDGCANPWPDKEIP